MAESQAGPTVQSGGEAPDRLLDELFPVMYPVLRRRAAQCFTGEALGHTLQATALVHEVYVKLATSKQTTTTSVTCMRLSREG